MRNNNDVANKQAATTFARELIGISLDSFETNIEMDTFLGCKFNSIADPIVCTVAWFTEFRGNERRNSE